jgi:hypothetical protein
LFNRRIISVASASAVLTAVGLLGTGTALASTTGPVQAPGADQGTAAQGALSQGLTAASDLAHPSGQMVVGPMKPAQGNQSQNPSQQDLSKWGAQAQSSRSEAQQDLSNDLASQKAVTGLLTCSVQVSLVPTCAN